MNARLATEAELQARLAMDAASSIMCGARADARAIIRRHYDPAWFVLEVARALVTAGVEPTLALADLRRLLSA